MPSVAPNLAITYRFPIYDAAATPATTRFSRRVTRGYQHRFTNYVRRVRPYRIGYAAQLARPNRFRQYPSGNHGSFRAAPRRRRLCADHYVVMRPMSQPPAEAGITPIPSVSHRIITLSHLHLPPRIGLIRLSLTCIRNHVIRISASLTLSAGRIVKEQILASRCHPLCWGTSVFRGCSCHIRRTEHQWIKMQTDHGHPSQAADLP